MIPRLLDGRVALVIGGGGEGVGAATSRTLAAAGARVAIADLDVASAETGAAAITTEGFEAAAFGVDVRAPGELDELVRAAEDSLGPLDVLVNNVGGSHRFVPRQSILEYTEEDWDMIVDLNLRYVFVSCRAAIRSFIASGRGGAIVNIGSIIGSEISGPMRTAYGAAKAGVKHLTQTLAVECGPHGIRVNSVSPGHIETAVVSGATSTRPTDTVPLRRHGEPREIATAVLFLASDLASYVNGQDIVVDGGSSRVSPFEPHPMLVPTSVEVS